MHNPIIRLSMSLMALFMFANCAATLHDRGHAFLRAKNYGGAIEAFRSGVRADSLNYKTWRDLGIAYFKNAQDDSALLALNRALALNNGDGSTIFYLGVIHERRQDYQQAMNHYRRYTQVSLFSKTRSQIVGRLKALTRLWLRKRIRDDLINEPAVAPDSTIAVLYFENLTQNEQLSRLQTGLAELIGYDLKKVKAVRVLERLRLDILLDELRREKIVGAVLENPPRLGKLLGAKTLVKGSIIPLGESNSSVRIEAQLVSTETGETIEAREVTGRLDDLFSLEKAFVFNLLDKLDLPITENERRAIQTIPTQDMLAFMSFSRGLELEARGRFEEAREQFVEAVARDPDFDMTTDKAGRRQRNTLARLAATGAMVNAGIVPGQDERDTVQEATGSEGFLGVPVQTQILIPPTIGNQQ